MTSFPDASVRIIRLATVKDKTGLSRSTIYAKVQLGEFPSPINLGARAVGWIDSEVDHWIGERVVASRSIVTARPTGGSE